MNPILWIDLETTGTLPERSAIIQIACALEIGGEIVETFSQKMRPHEGTLIDPKALEVQGVTEKEIWEWDDPAEVYDRYYSWLNENGQKGNKSARFIPAGYNAGFDLDFVRAFIDFYSGGPYAFWDFLQFKPIDPYPWIVTLWRYGRLPIIDCKLGTVCACLGIEIKAHDPMSDIMATREVTNRLLGKMQEVL